ncbi:MAG: cobalamin B12-binding domain-containing protein [Bacteroidetes bacterium]|jgi:DNA-binding transcriptional MerR regulator/methylmalonyl-CoA mutase cobalamin-binding subunit|nr:cobalamin B12-binding domain-containing protein [Bacteroidota bacterium]MBK7640115.1 cobalamin B12-binding domain-containing protein [Bacteroidota bacterium]
MSNSISTYSIKDLERLTGIKAHTLRIWEQRFSLFKASRTKTNIRYYTNEDLVFIINISILNHSGIKISKISTMDKEEIWAKVLELNSIENNHEIILTKLKVALLQYNEFDFLSILEDQIKNIGFENTIIDICFPLLRNVGILWLTKSLEPAQEHFATNLIRQKIIAEIDKLDWRQSQKSQSFLIANVENEFHEIGIIFSAYLVRKNGFRVVYLGKNVPITNILDFIENNKPDYYISVFTSYPQQKEINGFVEDIRNRSKKVKMIFSGYQMQNWENKENSNVITFQELAGFINFLKNI